ncbi:unnamed protein product [Dicrocoelium dendriticum]|nr:unnamed protein product [Dicrocoelium dendriticum]
MSSGADVVKTTRPTEKSKKMPILKSIQLPRSLATMKGKSDDELTINPKHTHLVRSDAGRSSQVSDPVSALLAYYRHKVSSLSEEPEQLQRRLDDIAEAMQIRETTTSALHQKEVEICDLKRALSDMQVYLFQEREHVLRLYAENDRLKINELDDKRKIQHLLQLSGLEPFEVTYFLKDNGAVISATPALAENASPCKPKHPSGLVVAPVVPQQPPPVGVEITASGKTVNKPVTTDTSVGASLSGLRGGGNLARSNVSRLEHEALIRELEVVRSSLRSMQTQLAEQTVVAKEQIDSLMEDRQVMQEESDALRKDFEEKLRLGNEQYVPSQFFMVTYFLFAKGTLLFMFLMTSELSCAGIVTAWK